MDPRAVRRLVFWTDAVAPDGARGGGRRDAVVTNRPPKHGATPLSYNAHASDAARVEGADSFAEYRASDDAAPSEAGEESEVGALVGPEAEAKASPAAAEVAAMGTSCLRT